LTTPCTSPSGSRCLAGCATPSWCVGDSVDEVQSWMVEL
jgi:hypothetical protein